MKNAKLSDKVTLALNPAWMPSHFLTKRRCFELMVREDKADALDKNFNAVKSHMWFDLENNQKFDDLPCIRSVHDVFMLPSIVVLNANFMAKNTICNSDISKHEMCAIFNFRCQSCGGKYKYKQLTIEHIDPKSKSHNNEDFNKTLTCKTCNSEKKDIEDWINPRTGEPLKGVGISEYVKLKFSVKEYRDEWGHFFIKKR